MSMDMMADDEAPSNEPILTLITGDGQKQEFYIGILCFLGRAPHCDIVLDAPGVADVHCILTRTISGLVVRDCFTATGTMLNGQRIQDALLGDGDSMRIGPFQMLLKAPPEENLAYSDAAAQQEMLHQMAQRIARLDGRRRKLAQRAWTIRQKARSARPPAGSPGPSGAGLSATGPLLPPSVMKRELDKMKAEAAKAKRYEEELTKLREQLAKAQGGSADVEALRQENQRLQNDLDALSKAATDLQAFKSLQDYEQQLNDFRTQLEQENGRLQQFEQDLAQREQNLGSGEGDLLQKLKEQELELSNSRAKLAREQATLERTRGEAKSELEEMEREAERLERDERLQKLRSQVHHTHDPTSATESGKLSERIRNFLKGLGR